MLGYGFLSKEENALIEYNSKNETNPRPVVQVRKLSNQPTPFQPFL